MKYLINLIFILSTSQCFCQNDTTILICPLKLDKIILNHHVKKMLKYNEVSIDSIKNTISKLTVSCLISRFPKYKFNNLLDNNEYKNILDSIVFTKQWDSFYIKKLLNSKGSESVFLTNSTNPKFKYDGLVIRERESKIFRELIKNLSGEYIFLFTKFETNTKLFSPISFLCLHFEIYNKSFEKIYGGKSYWPVKISTTMYSNVFYHFIRKAIDDLYGQLNLFLKPNELLDLERKVK